MHLVKLHGCTKYKETYITLLSRYNISFKTEIMDWVKKFAITGKVLENWILVQNLWMYLEAVFIGGDISKQLPLETKRFTVSMFLSVRIIFIITCAYSCLGYR